MQQLADPASERAVVDGVLADPSTLDELALRPSDFTDRRLGSIYQAMLHIQDAGRQIDLVAIADQLRVDGSAAGAADLAGLNPITSGNIGYYAGKVGELALVRQLVGLLNKVSAHVGQASSDELFDLLEGGLTEIAGAEQHEIAKISDMYGPAMDVIEQRYQSKGAPVGIPTGFRKIDELTTGFQPSEFIVIGARPSIGKTALALTIAMYMATHGVEVGFFSAEMAATSIMVRMLSTTGRVSSQRIRTGLLQASDFSRLMSASSLIQRASMYLDDTPNIKLTTFRSRARRMKRMGVQIIFLDYLTLIRHGDPRMPKHERVGEIVKEIKQLARELNIPIVALSQVRRDAEDKPPTLADLRQSGEIEEDADTVILLHRDRKASTESGEKDLTTYVDIAKQRNGPTDVVQLMFVPEYTTFEEKFHGGAA